MVNDAVQIPLALIRIAGLWEYPSQWVSVSFHADPGIVNLIAGNSQDGNRLLTALCLLSLIFRIVY